MAGSARRITVEFLGDGKNLSKELNGLQGKTSKFASFMGKVGKAAGIGLAIGGAAAVKFGVDSVQAASDAQQSLGATETVFGKFADSVVNDSNRAAKQFGLSANEYRENANLLGSLFKNQGVATDALAGKTKGMIGIGSDLAATFGGTTKDAVEALGSAFKGEFDPLEKYGISLKASTVSTEAMRLANIKSTAEFGKLSVAQQTTLKQQAASNLILQQSADSQGAFGRESDTLAHKQQVLGAQFENLKATVGNALLPVLTKAFGYVSDTVIPAVRNFVAEMKSGEGTGGKFADALGKIRDAAQKAWGILKPVISFLVDNKAAVATFAGVILTVAAAIKVWRTAQMLLNAAMAMNPLGLVLIAVAALAAGLVYAYKKSETFRKIVDSAMTAVGKVFRSFWNDFAQPIIKFFIEGLADMAGMFANIIEKMSHVPGFGWLKPLADGMHKAADQGHTLADSIKKIPNRTVTVNVVVNTSAIAKAQHQLDAAGFSGRRAGGTRAHGFSAAGVALIDSIVAGIDKGKVKLRTVLDKVGAYIQQHQDKLAELLDKRSSVVEAFRGFTSSIFGTDLSVEEGQAPKTIADLLKAGEQAKASALSLASNVKSLISKGLNRNLLEQLLASGEGGSAQIGLLASGSDADIQAANAQADATRVALEEAGLALGNALNGAEISAEEANLRLAQTISAELKKLRDQENKNTVVQLSIDGKILQVSLLKLKRHNGGAALGLS